MLVILIIGICILLAFHRTALFQDLYDEFLFFKYFGKGEVQENGITKEQIPQYKFDVTCYNTDFQEISLLETLKKETLVEGMLAPGVEGMFDVVLTTNANTKYEVIFQSQSDKPKNLKFETLGTNRTTNTIEELGTKGKLEENKVKIMTIHWFWEYENTKEGNIQDTIDSKKIENYQFTIHAIGEKAL